MVGVSIIQMCPLVKFNIHDMNKIYKLQHVYYKIADMLYRIKLLCIPYDTTKSYVTKSQRV